MPGSLQVLICHELRFLGENKKQNSRIGYMLSLSLQIEIKNTFILHECNLIPFERVKVGVCEECHVSYQAKHKLKMNRMDYSKCI